MAFVRANVEQKGERVQSLINKISTRLGPSNPDCLMQVITLSSNHLFDWVVQMHPPEVTVPVAVRVDSAIRSAFCSAAGVDLLDPGAAYSPCQLPARSFAADRARLPIRLRGTGLRSVADVAPAAFLGGLNMTLPDMINRAGPGDSMVPGLFHTPAMVEVLGEGSFDADGDDARFTAFEASGLPMAQQASASWTLSQLEGVMDDGPLTRPFNTMGRGGDKLQRAITKRRRTTGLLSWRMWPTCYQRGTFARWLSSSGLPRQAPCGTLRRWRPRSRPSSMSSQSARGLESRWGPYRASWAVGSGGAESVSTGLA